MGFKIHMLCDSESKYLNNLYFDPGKFGKDFIYFEDNPSITESIVLRLLSPIKDNKDPDTSKSIVLNQNNEEKGSNAHKFSGKISLVDAPKKECEICHKFIETHLLKIHLNSHPSQIFNWMFLGTYLNASDIKELRRIGINYTIFIFFIFHIFIHSKSDWFI